MFNKVNTRYLAITFFVLLALVIITSIAGSDKRNSSFKSELTSFDSASVAAINIYPKAGGEAVSLIRKDQKWFVVDGKEQYNADINQITSMLTSLSQLKAKRLAAKSKDKWAKYELTDSLCTRVELRDDKKALTNVYIGKFSYTQPPQSANPYMRGQGTMTSYVRVDDENEIYAVDGFLSMTFSRQAKDFRDSRVLHLQKENLARITFGDSNTSYALTKQDSIWMVSGLQADSGSVANYLAEITDVRSSDYLDKNNQPVGTPSHFVNFEDKDGSQLAKISIYYTDSTKVAISSTINPGTYFDGTKGGLFEKLFKKPDNFIDKK